MNDNWPRVILHIGDKPQKIKELNDLIGKNFLLVQFPNWDLGYSWLKDVNFSISIIISDMFSPICDTLTILEKIRSKYSKNYLPFVIYTEQPLNVYQERAKRLGANDVYCNRDFCENFICRIKGLIKLKESIIANPQKISLNTDNGITLKRVIDIVGAFIGLLLTMPIWLIILVAIKLESKGPAFYVSKRVGQGFKIFELFKFRTMYVDADKQIEKLKHLNSYQAENTKDTKTLNQDCEACCHKGEPCSPLLFEDGKVICERYANILKTGEQQTFFKFNKDPRITKLGGFLRRTSLDELPQILNILKGDISIVGNRPLPFYEAEQLTYDQAVTRFNAPAGLTGLWQVTKRGKPKMSVEERIALDNYYADNQSIWLDMKIFFKTFSAIWQSEKA